MSSQPGAATGSEDRSDHGEDARGRDEGASAASVVCFMCQQPIDPAVDRRWQGEPVHYQCGAEHRYRVSADDAERVDEGERADDADETGATGGD